MGSVMKGETVRGIWARRGWDSGWCWLGNWVGGGWNGSAYCCCTWLLLLRMPRCQCHDARKCHHEARSMVEHAGRKQEKGLPRTGCLTETSLCADLASDDVLYFSENTLSTSIKGRVQRR